MAEDEKEPINSELLQRIFKRSCRRLQMLAAEGEAELLEIIHRKAEALQDCGKEKDLEVTFSHTIKVNFSKCTQEDKLGGTIKVGLQLKGGFDDPDQGELFGEEEEGD
jgi:hypothetical protein